MYITKKYKKVIAKALKEKYNIVYSELNKFKTADEIMDYTLDKYSVCVEIYESYTDFINHMQDWYSNNIWLLEDYRTIQEFIDSYTWINRNLFLMKNGVVIYIDFDY